MTGERARLVLIGAVAAMLALGPGGIRAPGASASATRFTPFVCGSQVAFRAPSAAEVLAGTIRCADSAPIGAVLERGALTAPFAYGRSGTLRLAWYTRRARRLVAARTSAYRAKTDLVVRAKLTHLGRHLLEHASSLAVTAFGEFRPARGGAARARESPTLAEPRFEQCSPFAQGSLDVTYSWRVGKLTRVTCREAHRVLEALFLPEFLFPRDGLFAVGRWRCHSDPPPVVGSPEVPVRCTSSGRAISATWRIVSEA